MVLEANWKWEGPTRNLDKQNNLKKVILMVILNFAKQVGGGGVKPALAPTPSALTPTADS